MHVLLLDNYDSFTYNLADFLQQAGASVGVFRNDSIDPVTLGDQSWDGICLSPGPGRPSDAGVLMTLLRHWRHRLPILGVCLGHQALGELFGARLILAKEPVHGKTSRITCVEHPMFAGLPEHFSVMRYHSLLLESTEGTPFLPLAHTAAGELMAMAHRELPLWGVQFHPESILSEHGLAILTNWIKFAADHAEKQNRTPDYALKSPKDMAFGIHSGGRT